MKIGENGIIVFKMYDLDMSAVNKLIFTFRGIEKIEKEYPSEYVNYADNRFYVGLTQEDTVILSRNRRVKVQAEAQICFKNGAVAKSEIISFVLGETLNTTIIPGNSPSDFVDDIEFHYENGIIIIGGSGLTEERVREIIAGYHFATESELENYVTLSALNAKLNDYVTKNGLNDAIATYIDENVDLSQYATKTETEEALADKQDKTQFATMPTASADYLDKIVQYTGESTYAYQNGKNYKCVQMNIDNTVEYQWIDADVATGSNFITERKTSLPVASSEELGNTYQYIGNNKTNLQKGNSYTCVAKRKDALYQYIEPNKQNPNPNWIDEAYYRCVPTNVEGVTTYSYELFDTTGVDLNNYEVFQHKIMLTPNEQLADKTEDYYWVNSGFTGDGGIVTPQMFGAVGDGIHDDTEAIQQAFDAGGIIYFPAGVYLVSREHSAYPNSGCVRIRKSNTTVIGEKGKSILKADYSIKRNGLDLLTVRDYISNITISNLTFLGLEKFGDPQGGISLLGFWQVNNINVFDCLFQNNGYAALIFRGCNNVMVDRNRIEACDCGIVQQTYACSDVTIRNCHITGLSSINDYKQMYSEPIGIMCDGSEEFGGPCERWVIENCIIEHKNTSAIAINGIGSVSSYSDGRIIARNWAIRNITVNDVKNAVVVSNAENVIVEDVTYIDSEEALRLISNDDERKFIAHVEYSHDIVLRNMTSFVSLTQGIRINDCVNCTFENFYLSDITTNALLQRLEKCVFRNFVINAKNSSPRIMAQYSLTDCLLDIRSTYGALYKPALVLNDQSLTVNSNNVIIVTGVQGGLLPLIIGHKKSTSEVETNKYIFVNSPSRQSYKTSIINDDYILSDYYVNMNADGLTASLAQESYNLLSEGQEFNLYLNVTSSSVGNSFRYATTGNIIPIADEEFGIAPASVFTVISHFKQNGNKWVETQRLKKYANGRIEDISHPDLVTRSEMEQYIQETDTIPTASADYVGKSYLYTGNTTATYQKGGIYECQEVLPSTSPATYHWVQIGVSTTQITELLSAITSATDFADLQSRLQSYVQS